MSETNFSCRGFSVNVALLSWAIASGFLLQFFETLLLTGQMSPKYGDFIDTRRDLATSKTTLSKKVIILAKHIIFNHFALVLPPMKQWIIVQMSYLEEYSKLAEVHQSILRMN